MANKKISQLTVATEAITTDNFVIARSGANLSMTLALVRGDAYDLPFSSPTGTIVANNVGDAIQELEDDIIALDADSISFTSGTGTIAAVTVGNAIREINDDINEFLFEASPLYIDQANLRMGVNTAAPSQPLHVSGGVIEEVALFESSGSFTDIYLKDVDTTLGQVRLRCDADTFQVITNTTVRTTVDASGNMGVGVATPDGRLHVHAGSAGVVAANASGDDFVVENSGVNGMSLLSPDANGSWFIFGSPSNNIYASIRGWYNAGNPYLFMDAGGSTTIAMYQNQVAVGTSVVPDGTLHVHTATAGAVTAGASADDLVVENSTDVGVTLLSPLSTSGSLFFGNGSSNSEGRIRFTHGASVNTGYMTFHTAATEFLRLTSSQRAGFGTTSPDGTLHVHTASAGVVTASTVADDVVIENNADGGISILTPDTSFSTLFFGSPTDNIGAFMQWKYSTLLAELGTHVASAELSIKSGNNTEAVRIDSSQNVVIGTTTATAKLDVYDTASSYQINVRSSSGVGRKAGINYRIDATNLWQTYVDNTDSNKWKLRYNDTTDYLYVTNAGNVGIKQSAPDGTLHVHTATAGVVTANANADDLIVESSGNTGISIIGPDASNSSLYFGSPTDNIGSYVTWHYNNSLMQIGTSKVGAALRIDSGDAIQAVRIDSSQNVGIGISTPDGRLHVHTATAGVVTANANADDLIVENSSNAGISILTPNTGTASLYFGDADINDRGYVQYNHTSDYLRFGAASTEAMRIDSSQNVGIGGAPSAGRLDVNSNGLTDHVVRIDAADNRGASRYALYVNDSDANSRGSVRIETTTGPSLTTSGGNVGIGISSPDGTFHVHTATAGTVTAGSAGDDFIIENSAAGGMSILTPDASSSNIYFGSPTANTAAFISWQYSTATFNMGSSTVSSTTSVFTGTATAAIKASSSNNISINSNTINLAKIYADQSSTTGALPVLRLDQADVSEEFMRFVGSAAAATLTQSIVAEGDVTTPTRQGWLKIYVQDDGNQITDQAYYIPIYTLA